MCVYRPFVWNSSPCPPPPFLARYNYVHHCADPLDWSTQVGGGGGIPTTYSHRTTKDTITITEELLLRWLIFSTVLVDIFSAAQYMIAPLPWSQVRRGVVTRGGP